jgi:hypothetical protein
MEAWKLEDKKIHKGFEDGKWITYFQDHIPFEKKTFRICLYDMYFQLVWIMKDS